MYRLFFWATIQLPSHDRDLILVMYAWLILASFLALSSNFN